MRRHTGWLVAGIAVAWPILLHVAAMAGRQDLMPAVTMVAAVSLALVLGATARARWGVTGALAAVIAIVATYAFVPELLLFAPPGVLNAALAVAFGSTLGPGREPAIARFARLERGELEPDLAAHARAVTVAWTALFTGMAVASVLLAMLAPVETWSLFTNVVSYALVGALFVGEYVYRRVRFAQYRHASLFDLVRLVIRHRGPAWKRGAS